MEQANVTASRVDDLESRARESLKRLRQERGWSQEELAAKMVAAGWHKYNQMAVSRVEGGSKPISLNEAKTFADIFGVDLFKLWASDKQRLLLDAQETVERMAKQLEDLAENYLHQRALLVVRADNSNLPREALDYVSQLVTVTPEAAVRRARSRVERKGSAFIEDMLSHIQAPGVEAAEERHRKDRSPGAFMRLADEVDRAETGGGDSNGDD